DTIRGLHQVAENLVRYQRSVDGDLEMRKFFGSKVVLSSKTTRVASKRVNAAHRSTLMNPKPNWWPPQLREGLSIRQLTPNEHEDKLFRHGWSGRQEVWWTVEYGKKYRAITMAFMQIVMSGDPEGFNHLLRAQPYHADTLLQLAEVYSHREEYSTASDFIDRALLTYERAFIGAFNFMGGCHRLDFDRVENRPFFLALHRQLVDLHRRGCTRTAFEFAKLLYSLDPWTDPHGSLLHLDGLALKAGMHEWILGVWEYFETEQDGLEGRMIPTDATGSQDHTSSVQAFVAAVSRFPSLLPLLADKTDVALSAEIISKPAFKVHVDSSSLSSQTDAAVQLLCGGGCHSTWLSECIKSLSSMISIPASTEQDRTTVLAATTTHNSIYRHVIVLEKTCRSLFSFIPKEILNSRQLSCDPLLPFLRVSEYDAEFFRGVEDVVGYRPRRHNAREEERLLERLLPDGVFRRQLQDFFAAHPDFAQRFPGGIIQFAQLAAQLPEDALEDLMIAEADGIVAQNPNVGMPGQLQGEVGVLDFEPAFADQAPIVRGVEGDGSDDEADIEPLPVRLLRNIVNCFFGGPEISESSNSDEGGNLDQDGVD
ncbi:transcriptional repressor TCF25-domain-containing protein, partial [Thelephora terrestris]